MSHANSPQIRTPSYSRTTMTELVLPNHANVQGNILGGRVMHLIDLVGAMTAARHSRLQVVTATVDSLVFLHPVKVGDLILLEANLTRSFHTSMEVIVHVHSEALHTGERVQTSTSFLTFVALDSKGKPCSVPSVRPESKLEKERYVSALIRREYRLESRLKCDL